MTEISESARLIQVTLMRSMRQQMGNISHSRKDYSHARTPNRKYYYSHARHATSLYTKSWLVLCDCRAMLNTALQTLMRHLHRLFTLSLSLLRQRLSFNRFSVSSCPLPETLRVTTYKMRRADF